MSCANCEKLQEEIAQLQARPIRIARTGENILSKEFQNASDLYQAKIEIEEAREERDQLRAENEKQASRISELEAGLQEGFQFIGGDYGASDWRRKMFKLLSPKDTQGEG